MFQSDVDEVGPLPSVLGDYRPGEPTEEFPAFANQDAVPVGYKYSNHGLNWGSLGPSLIGSSRVGTPCRSTDRLDRARLHEEANRSCGDLFGHRLSEQRDAGQREVRPVRDP